MQSTQIQNYYLLVLFKPPALAGTWLGSFICLAKWYSSSSFRVSSCGSSWSRTWPLATIYRIIKPGTVYFHTSAMPLILRRSRGGNCITSVFSLCSVRSLETGLDTTVGLSFADTQLATPWSGRSLERFPITAHTKLLCKCSVLGSAQMI